VAKNPGLSGHSDRQLELLSLGWYFQKPRRIPCNARENLVKGSLQDIPIISIFAAARRCWDVGKFQFLKLAQPILVGHFLGYYWFPRNFAPVASADPRTWAVIRIEHPKTKTCEREVA